MRARCAIVGLVCASLAACESRGASAPAASDEAGTSFDASASADAGTLDAKVNADDATIPSIDAATPIEAGPPAYDLHADDRTGCAFGQGDTTTSTIGPDVPHGDALPFHHVIVIMMENRSFDSYLSELPASGVTDVDVADRNASNPDPGNGTVTRFHETRYCTLDNAHEWDSVHLQYDNGNMDGFVSTSNPGGARAMGYYDATDLPYYYWLASTFAISDRYFASTLGPTWPNRYFLWGATAWGRTATDIESDRPPLGAQTLFDEVSDAGHTWAYYTSAFPSFGLLFGSSYYGTAISDLENAINTGTLPDVAFVDPTFSGTSENDEHPPTNIQLGQAFTSNLIDLLMTSPSWSDTVLFLTYDEHGGYYDHVAPPAACAPDDELPPDYDYARYGIRVPMVVVSPFAKKNYVSHMVMDHTSIVRFIENRFDLPAMTHRDANAWPMLDLFDFDAVPFATAPTNYPSSTPSAAGITWCADNDAGTGEP